MEISEIDSMGKTALIVEGGGQRGVFSFGVVDSFIEGNFDPFDFFVGVSNGASVLFWYLIRDKLNNLEKMLYSADSKYFSYKNIFLGKDILDFYGLFKDAYLHFQPNLSLLKSNLAHRPFLSVVTDAISATPQYINYDQEKIIDILVATGTLPVLVRRPSFISGARVFDGGISDPLPVRKAYEMGARKVIVISTFGAAIFAIIAIFVSKQMYLPGSLATSKTWFYIFFILFSFCSLPMFSLILAHTNDYISKDKFVAAGAGLQFAFGLGAMSGPFLCSIFMDLVGSNGFFIFLFFFHSVIGIFGIYRMRVRQTVDNPDSQFVAMPQTITPAGIELNPTTEPIEEPIKEENKT